MDLQTYILWPPLGRLSSGFARRWYYAALALFVFTATFFSSNIQTSFPAFSKWFRLGACALVAAMMLAKIYLFRPLSAGEFGRVTALLAAALVLSLVSRDFWMAASALLVAGAGDVELEKALKVYVLTHLGSLVLVFAAHGAGILPFVEIGRDPRFFDWGHGTYSDWGFGHYNGFAGRLLGLFGGAIALFQQRMKLWGWGLAACAAFGISVWTTSRAASAAMALVLLVMLMLRYLPALMKSRPVLWLLQAVLPVCCGFSLYGMFTFDPSSRFWERADLLDNMRFSLGHAKWLESGFRLLGGVPVDTGTASCADNFYMATLLNKGVLGLLFVLIVFAALMWVLPRKGHWAAAYGIAVMLIYGMAENRMFSLIYNPLLLWGSLLLYQAKSAPPPQNPKKQKKQK